MAASAQLSLSAPQLIWRPPLQPSRLSQSLDRRCPSREKSSRSASRWTVSCGLKVTPEWSPRRTPATRTLCVMCAICWHLWHACFLEIFETLLSLTPSTLAFWFWRYTSLLLYCIVLCCIVPGEIFRHLHWTTQKLCYSDRTVTAFLQCEVVDFVVYLSGWPWFVIPAGLLRPNPVNGRTSIISDTCRFARSRCWFWTMVNTEIQPVRVVFKHELTTLMNSDITAKLSADDTVWTMSYIDDTLNFTQNCAYWYRRVFGLQFT